MPREPTESRKVACTVHSLLYLLLPRLFKAVSRGGFNLVSSTLRDRASASSIVVEAFEASSLRQAIKSDDRDNEYVS